MLNKISLLPPVSSRPGVKLEIANFDAHGASRFPFEGGKFTVAKGSTSKPDNHAVSECWMVINGTGTISYDGDLIKVSAGDCLFFEPFKTHFMINDGAEEVIILTIWWLE